MVQELYRIQWKGKTGPWRYLDGEMYLLIDKDSKLDKGKPCLFKTRQKAEQVTRALTDLPQVAKVELREESTVLSLDGAGA